MSRTIPAPYIIPLSQLTLILTHKSMAKQLVIVDGKEWPLEDILASPSLMRDIIIALSKDAELPVILQST